MAQRWFGHGVRGAACAALALVLCTTAAAARPKPGATRHLNLFAGFNGRMNVNRWDCGADATGHVCNDPAGSTTVGGGFWPKGTPDQYVFGSGIQVAGVVDPTLTSFAWHGDTTAAFFEDPSGTHENGSPLSLIWQSTSTSDLDTWPRDAYVPNDTSLYSPILIGRKTASQEDVWSRYWDGDPSKNAGRPHPLGVLVDERGMAWNFPSGNQDIQYWIFTVTNVTSANGKVYAGRPDADSLTALGVRYRDAMTTGFKVAVPDTGYAITNAYFAFAIDADVEASGATQNFTTVNLPFNMGVAFKSDWNAPDFKYPTTSGIWTAPFAETVGEVGVKYLKSPLVNPSNPALGQIGLVLYSSTTNAGSFGDAANAAQLYRYLKGSLDPSKGDQPCNYAPGVTPSLVHVCYIQTTPFDIRFFQSSGPFTLKPGESQTIAVAYIGAAPVENPAIKNRGGAGFVFPNGGPIGAFGPQQPESLATGSQHLTALDSIFGALSIVGDTGGGPKPAGGPNGKIDQNELRVVPRSLLGKGLVAQAVFDAKFLLPFPPDPPDFFLIPGDNSVTVVWKASPSEVTGDPYFAIASNPTSALYDPNYRHFDVEGYRVYRGRTSGDLTVIAQFDKTGTTFIDYTGEISSPNCAPELGVKTGCPAPFDSAPPYTVSDTVPLVGDIVQIPPGGRVKLADSSILVLTADTAVTGGGTNVPKLRDTGVPFAFVDNGVLNGFTYFYTVAAFDLNSVLSTGQGSTSLEGRFPAKSVIPRKNSAQVNQGQLTLSLAGAGGVALPAGSAPSLDKNGIFSGPAQPTNGFAIGFPAFIPAVVTKDSVNVTIDSVMPGNPDPDGLGTGGPPVYYVHATGPFPSTPIVMTLPVDPIDVDTSSSAQLPAIKFNQKQAGIYGGDSTYTLLPEVTISASATWRTASWGRASINADPANSDFNGPRWWAGAANENTNDPVGLQCSPASGGCLQADLSRNAGAISGVGIFHPHAYSTVNSNPPRDLEAVGATVVRAADFKVYWGATAGAVDSVVDVTHKVKVPFKTYMGPSWGILNDSSFTGLAKATVPDTSAVLTWTDAFCVAPASTLLTNGPGGPPRCGVTAPLMDHAKLEPVVFKSSSFANAATLTAAPATGNGFIFYLNGHFFVMQMAALPASTVWNARFYAGNIVGTAGSYVFQAAKFRPPAVPGLTAKAVFTSTTFNAAVTTDSALALIHTVPDPYYVTNSFESSPNEKIIRFVHLPSQCIIRIYSLSGVLVQMIAVNDATGGAEAQWDLRNRNNQFVASGVYFWHVETPDGKQKIGRFTLVNFAK